MKRTTKKVYKRINNNKTNKNYNKKNNNKGKKQNNKPHYKFNSSIIHPASIILPRK